MEKKLLTLDINNSIKDQRTLFQNIAYTITNTNSSINMKYIYIDRSECFLRFLLNSCGERNLKHLRANFHPPWVIVCDFSFANFVNFCYPVLSDEYIQ